ncbi:MAG: esterase, partial [Vicinamibacteria bacterium]
ADFERRAAAFLDDAERTNRQLKLLSLSVGSEDFLLPGMKNLAQILTRRGIKYELQTSGGGHTWINWRHYLRDLLPQLFRTGAGPS